MNRNLLFFIITLSLSTSEDNPIELKTDVSPPDVAGRGYKLALFSRHCLRFWRSYLCANPRNGCSKAGTNGSATRIADGNYLDAYDHHALSLEKLGKFDEAEQVLATAAKLSPNSVSRQLHLGTIALKLGNLVVAEEAFRKCMRVGKHSIRKTPEAYFGLARVCGQKEDIKQALQVLAEAQTAFDNEEVKLHAKITEGLVYHEAGDFSRARKTSEEAAKMFSAAKVRPSISVTLDTARRWSHAHHNGCRQSTTPHSIVWH